MARTGGRPQDHYARRAKASGFPARSVFKLEQIEQRQRILSPGDAVLDLGAAPGSWSRYAASAIGPSGRVLAVDLKTFSVAPQGRSAPVTVMQGDFTEAAVLDLIAAAGPFDVIISDAAPSTTGNRLVDTGRSEALAECVVSFAARVLRTGGSLLFKLFDGSGREAILATMRSEFAVVRTMRPDAVRSQSFELYILGQKKRPPRTGTDGIPEEVRGPSDDAQHP